MDYWQIVLLTAVLVVAIASIYIIALHHYYERELDKAQVEIEELESAYSKVLIEGYNREDE